MCEACRDELVRLFRPADFEYEWWAAEPEPVEVEVPPVASRLTECCMEHPILDVEPRSRGRDPERCRRRTERASGDGWEGALVQALGARAVEV